MNKCWWALGWIVNHGGEDRVMLVVRADDGAGDYTKCGGFYVGDRADDHEWSWTLIYTGDLAKAADRALKMNHDQSLVGWRIVAGPATANVAPSQVDPLKLYGFTDAEIGDALQPLLGDLEKVAAGFVMV